jgi:hypothetical protein
MQVPDVQYIHQIQKGSTVMHGNKHYRVQDDGRGYLHIIVQEQGKRKKIGIDKILFFEPSTQTDYVFNGWFYIYTWEEYYSYCQAELNWQQW